jgi:hypothetical protein
MLYEVYAILRFFYDGATLRRRPAIKFFASRRSETMFGKKFFASRRSETFLEKNSLRRAGAKPCLGKNSLRRVGATTLRKHFQYFASAVRMEYFFVAYNKS